MKLRLLPGKYILAVSGGVDSMVLLDLLAKMPGVELVVAHFDHGIRPDSKKDEELVRKIAASYKLSYESAEGKLGPGTSEETARNARYGFLKHLQAEHEAKAIITAHHQDDLIETAFINLIRGTGRLGLSAIATNKRVRRPLLDTPKAEIEAYARKHKLQWREDATNQSPDYLRNRLRLSVIPRLTILQRESLISYIDKVAKTNTKIDKEIATLSHNIDINMINRRQFSGLPTNLGNELIAHFLRRAAVVDFDSKTVNRLSMAIKTSKANSIHPIKQRSSLMVSTETASFTTP
jgi:tRNA(Ile)-lysidine synthetase-like protein